MHAFKNGSKFCTIETNDVKSVFHIALQELYSFIFLMQLTIVNKKR